MPSSVVTLRLVSLLVRYVYLVGHEGHHDVGTRVDVHFLQPSIDVVEAVSASYIEDQ